MSICQACGVELADDARRCPLCGIPVSHETREVSSSTYPEHIFNAENTERISRREVGKIIVEILSVSCVIAIAITTLLDVFLSGGFSWSPVSTASIAAGWLLFAMPVILGERPWILFAVLAPSAVAFVLALDAVDGSLSWFFSLGLPISLLVDAAWAAVMGVCSGFREKGLNVFSTIFLGVAFMLVGIDVSINLYFGAPWVPRWSVIAAFALVPIAVFCLYLHYRITKRASLRKLFRL